jgi:hypothetical protein
LLHANALADQVGRLADAFAGVDEHEAVAEAPMQKHRDRSGRKALVTRHNEGGAGRFRHVEFASAQKAPVAGGGVHAGEHGEVDAVGLHHAFLERTDDLVVATGERQ